MSRRDTIHCGARWILTPRSLPGRNTARLPRMWAWAISGLSRRARRPSWKAMPPSQHEQPRAAGDPDDDILADIDPTTRKLWNAQTRARMAYQRRDRALAARAGRSGKPRRERRLTRPRRNDDPLTPIEAWIARRSPDRAHRARGDGRKVPLTPTPCGGSCRPPACSAPSPALLRRGRKDK